MLRQSLLRLRAVGVTAAWSGSGRFLHVSPAPRNITRVIIKQPFYRTALFYLRKTFKWKVRMATPPYDHATQVGDPVLRGKSAPVDPQEIRTKEFQNLIKKMVEVMRKTGGVGLAAPQIGVARQVFVMEFNEKHYDNFPEDIRKAREMQVVPLRVFINPRLKVMSDKTVTLPEGCLSLNGFTAATPRAYEVEISGD